MALTQISTAGVKDDAVTAGKIPADAIGSSEIAANAVGSSELADNAVDTAAIADDAVTDAKLANSINTAIAANTAKVQTTINNNADNRVITGSGTANTLEGESALTFDGNSLVLENTTGNIKNVRNGGGATLNLQGNQDSGNTVPNDGSDVGNLAFSTADGTDRNNVIAYISTVRDGGTFNNSSHPSKIKLMTCPSGSTTITSRLEVKSSGDVSIVDGNLVLASGHGIDFSDTANASATGTSMSNELLDDYEEGTWTPTTENSGGGYQNIISATYTKIGRLVNVSVYAVFNSSQPNSNEVRIGGLPFVSISAIYHYAVGRLQGHGISDFSVQVGGTSDYFTPYYNNAVLTYNLVAGYYFLISGSYITNS